MGKHRKFEFGEYDLMIFRKGLVDFDNYYANETGSVYCTGTMVYKKLDSRQSIIQLLSDLIENKFEPDKIHGTFLIFFQINGKQYYLTDGTQNYNVYYDENEKIYSSSFLLLVNSCKRKFRINKIAISEILTTGFLIGPETVLEGVYRLEGYKQITNIVRIERSAMKLQPVSSFTEGIEQQTDVLQSYFKSIKCLADENSVSAGLTGGFDSRLIAALAVKNFKNVSLHSTWRKRKTLELICAEKVAAKYQIELRSPEVKLITDMEEDDLKSNLNDAFYFNDGHVRAFSSWSEVVNTLSYRKLILGNCRLSLNGVGGEQYRNKDAMISKRWNLSKWIKYDMVRQAGNVFTDSSSENELIDHLSSKIGNKLSIAEKSYINFKDLKRYYNEVYIPAGRGLRDSKENKASFCLTPFADYTVSYKAYEITGVLGISNRFHIEMLKKIAPELNDLELDYGYSVSGGEPFKNKLAAYLKEILPKSVQYQIRMVVKSTDSRMETLLGKSKYVKGLLLKLESLNLPFNYELLFRSNTLGLIPLDFGYFLEKLEDKLSF